MMLVGVGFGVRWMTTQATGPPSDSALEILRQRYARGEIDSEKFEARKRNLQER
jgi:uncharacterized membrane protein